MYLCHRSWHTWDHRGPRWSPSVWRAAASTTTTSTRAPTTVPPQLPLPSQTEAAVSVPGAPRAARQRSGTERRAGQGADVRWPSCDEDCAGATKHQGDADLFTVWYLRTCLEAVCHHLYLLLLYQGLDSAIVDCGDAMYQSTFEDYVSAHI